MTDYSRWKRVPLCPGQEIEIGPRFPISPYELFAAVVFAAASFPGEDVVCRSFLPGLDLCIHAETPIICDAATLTKAWRLIQHWLDGWLADAPLKKELAISLDDVHVVFVQGRSPATGIVTFQREWLASQVDG